MVIGVSIFSLFLRYSHILLGLNIIHFTTISIQEKYYVTTVSWSSLVCSDSLPCYQRPKYCTTYIHCGPQIQNLLLKSFCSLKEWLDKMHCLAVYGIWITWITKEKVFCCGFKSNFSEIRHHYCSVIWEWAVLQIIFAGLPSSSTRTSRCINHMDLRIKIII